MKPPRFALGDKVIADNKKTEYMIIIDTAKWHVGYGQWLFNKGAETEVFETQITHYYSLKKERWVKNPII